MRNPHQPSGRFGSELSRVLYIDMDVQGAIRPAISEIALVDAICLGIAAGKSADLHAMCFHIETRVIPYLSGESVLKLAEAIETRASWMFDNIPRLAAHRSRLRRASDFADTFGQEKLSALMVALKEETRRV